MEDEPRSTQDCLLWIRRTLFLVTEGSVVPWGLGRWGLIKKDTRKLSGVKMECSGS